MDVNVRLFGILRFLAQERVVKLNIGEGSNVSDVITELGKRLGAHFLSRIVRAPGELHSYCQIFVNDTQVDDLATQIKPNGRAVEVGIILLAASEGG